MYTAAHSVSKSTASITIAMRHLKSISRKQVEASKRVKIGMLSSSNGLAYDDTNFKVVERVSRPCGSANHFRTSGSGDLRASQTGRKGVP